MESDYKYIRFSRKNGIATILLNRPPLNILNIEMMKEINQALSEISDDKALKLLILRAEGKAFSAGVDVAEHTVEKVEEMIKAFHQMFRLLYSLPAPSLAVVEGAALGGGCELATFCDMIIASDKAKFGQPEIKVGVFPPIAALAFPWKIGLSRALELILTGDTIDAAEAERINLINKVFPANQFSDKSEEFIQKIAQMSSEVLRLSKKATLQPLPIDFAHALERIEDIYLKELMSTEDALEGLSAFLEKRKPQWKGK